VNRCLDRAHGGGGGGGGDGRGRAVRERRPSLTPADRALVPEHLLQQRVQRISMAHAGDRMPPNGHLYVLVTAVHRRLPPPAAPPTFVFLSAWFEGHRHACVPQPWRPTSSTASAAASGTGAVAFASGAAQPVSTPVHVMPLALELLLPVDRYYGPSPIVLEVWESAAIVPGNSRSQAGSPLSFGPSYPPLATFTLSGKAVLTLADAVSTVHGPAAAHALAAHHYLRKHAGGDDGDVATGRRVAGDGVGAGAANAGIATSPMGRVLPSWIARRHVLDSVGLPSAPLPARSPAAQRTLAATPSGATTPRTPHLSPGTGAAAHGSGSVARSGGDGSSGGGGGGGQGVVRRTASGRMAAVPIAPPRHAVFASEWGAGSSDSKETEDGGSGEGPSVRDRTPTPHPDHDPLGASDADAEAPGQRHLPGVHRGLELPHRASQRIQALLDAPDLNPVDRWVLELAAARAAASTRAGAVGAAASASALVGMAPPTALSPAHGPLVHGASGDGGGGGGDGGGGGGGRTRQAALWSSDTSDEHDEEPPRRRRPSPVVSAPVREGSLGQVDGALEDLSFVRRGARRPPRPATPPRPPMTQGGVRAPSSWFADMMARNPVPPWRSPSSAAAPLLPPAPQHGAVTTLLPGRREESGTASVPSTAFQVAATPAGNLQWVNCTPVRQHTAPCVIAPWLRKPVARHPAETAPPPRGWLAATLAALFAPLTACAGGGGGEVVDDAAHEGARTPGSATSPAASPAATPTKTKPAAREAHAAWVRVELLYVREAQVRGEVRFGVPGALHSAVTRPALLLGLLKRLGAEVTNLRPRLALSPSLCIPAPSVAEWACLAGHADAVRAMLKCAPVSPRVAPQSGWHALHFAALGGNADVVQLLIAHVTAQARALGWAIPGEGEEDGAASAAARWARRGRWRAHLHMDPDDGEAVHAVWTVRNPATLDELDATPTLASLNGMVDTWLRDAASAPAASGGADTSRSHPLAFAFAVAPALRCPDSSGATRRDGTTTVAAATHVPRREAATILRPQRRGQSPCDIVDGYGNTPLMVAAARGHDAAVKALLAAHCSPLATNGAGDCAVSIAIRGRHWAAATDLVTAALSHPP
jgi:hypothetical protein